MEPWELKYFLVMLIYYLKIFSFPGLVLIIGLIIYWYSNKKTAEQQMVNETELNDVIVFAPTPIEERTGICNGSSNICCCFPGKAESAASGDGGTPNNEED